MSNSTFFKLGKGNFVLHGYDTERDLERAARDVKRALCIVEGSTAQVYGYFNNDECAMLFMQKLGELLGVTKLNKREDINDDDGKSV